MKNDLTKQREYFNKAIETLRNRPAHTFKDGTTITFNEFYEVDKTEEDIERIFADIESSADPVFDEEGCRLTVSTPMLDTQDGSISGWLECKILNCSSVEEAIGIMVSMAVNRITDKDNDILFHKRKDFAK